MASNNTNFSVDFSGQAAIVTGGGGGIGRAVALALSAAGASVVVNDVNPDRADSVVDEIIAAGGTAAPWQGDVCNRFQAAAMIEHARTLYGNVRILVNAAGVYKADTVYKLDEWDWRRLVDVNLTGTFFCCQLMGRVMTDEGGGVMVNVASSWALGGLLAQGIGYTASKAGVIGLTKAAALEFAPAGIRVNAVCPGGIVEDDMPEPDTARIPLAAHAANTPEAVAQSVLFLCSDAAAFITGQTLVIDGGAGLVG